MITNYRLFKAKVLPSDNVLPNSYKKVKKFLKMLGVEYVSYHACLDDCILYRGEYVVKEMCLKCGHDRYHNKKREGKLHGPHNILRNMPITQRI